MRCVVDRHSGKLIRGSSVSCMKVSHVACNILRCVYINAWTYEHIVVLNIIEDKQNVNMQIYKLMNILRSEYINIHVLTYYHVNVSAC